MKSRIVSDALDIPLLTGAFQDVSRGAGAVVTFTGLVRDFNIDGAIDGLELEHYPGMTEKALTDLAENTKQRFNCTQVTIVHRVGKILNFEPIVWVGAASLHRKAAFDAAMYAMDTLKRDIPLWKKEWRNGKSEWVAAKTSDADAAEQWSITQ